MRCLDDDLVLGLVEGRLAPPVLAGVDAHLDACETCRDVIAQVARTAAPSKVLERGHTVDRYVIGELLGTGAMGRVYSAWEPELDRRVALKVLVDRDHGRIVREAQAMAKLDHPNVVGVHEVGTAPEGVYVAMDLVEGETLRAWAGRAHTVEDKRAVLEQVARGLAAAHAAGVIHRDVKPDNVIVGHDGRTRIGDFGLARATGGDEPAGTRADGELAGGTPPTSVAGTPVYMAPEVLRGEAATALSDQFSFGVTAYEVLAGRRPFAGTTWTALLGAITTEKVQPPPGVPGWLAEAITRCLAPDPRARFASMAEVARVLAPRARGRGRWVAGIAAAAMVASGATWFAVHGAAPRTCSVGADIDTVWNATSRGKLAALPAPVLAALDRWAASWSAARAAICGAQVSEPTMVARTSCLDHRRAELGALLDRVGDGHALGDRISDALVALPSPAECATIEPGSGDPVPLGQVQPVSTVMDALPAVRVAIALGDARPVVAKAWELAAQARASGHAPTDAEALLVLTDALRNTGDLEMAALTARDALTAAERGHADVLAARAWLARVAVAGDRRELAAAEDAGIVAEGAVVRAGSPPRLLAVLERQRGLIAYNRGLLAEARRHLRAAMTAFTTLDGAWSLEVATTGAALGSVERAAGDLEAAQQLLEQARRVDGSLRGEPSAAVIRDEHNLAGVYRLRGNLVDAAHHYLIALTYEEQLLGERSVAAALTHNSLGLVNIALGEWDKAREHLTVARDVLTAAGHGDRAFALHNLAIVEAYLRDHTAALRDFTAAGEVYHATIGDSAPAAIRLLVDRARSELALGDVAHARAHATAARDAAAHAGIGWIVADANQLLTAHEVGKPPAAVDVIVEAPPVTEPQPKRDVGVYGASQTW